MVKNRRHSARLVLCRQLTYTNFVLFVYFLLYFLYNGQTCCHMISPFNNELLETNIRSKYSNTYTTHARHAKAYMSAHLVEGNFAKFKTTPKPLDISKHASNYQHQRVCRKLAQICHRPFTSLLESGIKIVHKFLWHRFPTTRQLRLGCLRWLHRTTDWHRRIRGNQY